MRAHRIFATLVALVVAGACSSAPDAAPSAATAPTTTARVTSSTLPTTAPLPTTAAMPTAGDEADRCRSQQLTVSLGQPGAAAGTAYQPVVFTNHGDGDCSLVGFPGISFRGSDGGQAGPAASRQGDAGDPVTIPPGGAASALVELSNPGVYPPETCGTTVAVTTLRVYAPDTTDAVDLPFRGETCSADVGQLRVEPVVEGQSGQSG